MPFVFPDISSHFTWATAATLCSVAFATYEIQYGPLNGYEPAEVMQFSYEQLDTLAIVVKQGSKAIVAFRGTQGSKIFESWIDSRYNIAWEDLLVDFRCSDVDFLGFGDARVHAGFLEALDSIGDEIYRVLKDPKLTEVAFTGHSLGGAIATLAALRAEREGIKVSSVYTFGSPRVGNQKFALAYNQLLGDRTFRIVNEGDLVSLLPSRDRPLLHSILLLVEQQIRLYKNIPEADSYEQAIENLLSVFFHQLDYSHVGTPIIVGSDPCLTDWAAYIEKPLPTEAIQLFFTSRAAAHLGYPTALRAYANAASPALHLPIPPG
jgi:pimeloyl-ACP methyl ester carboxylesterase